MGKIIRTGVLVTAGLLAASGAVIYVGPAALAQTVSPYLYLPNKNISGRNIRSIDGQTPASCSRLCNDESACLSFEVDNAGTCWLQDANRATAELVPSDTYDYYERRRPRRTASATSSGAQIARVWNSGGCSYTDTSSLALGSDTKVDRLEIWYNWAAGESEMPYEILAGDGRAVWQGTFERRSCDSNQRSWCVAGDNPGASLPAGNYTVRVPNRKVCQNADSGGEGFIQAWGSAGRPRTSRPPERATRIAECSSNATEYRGSGRVISCHCDTAAMASGTVWGTDVYTDDSKICRAALHAGTIGSGGGNVSFRMVGARASYQASSRRGVDSASYGSWQGSYRFE